MGWFSLKSPGEKVDKIENRKIKERCRGQGIR
jgi:hypothetical protein